MSAEKPENSAPQWYVYIVQTAAGALYTGITIDPVRRLAEHGGGGKGARSLRGKGPLKLVFTLATASRSSASRLEARIKKLDRPAKLRLIAGELGGADLLH